MKNSRKYAIGFFLLLLSCHLLQEKNFLSAYDGGDLDAYYDDELTLHEDYYPTSVLANENQYLKNGTSVSQQIKDLQLYSGLTADQKPNIIFIVADDQPYSLLGASGNPKIKTPNLDNFAANEGIFFENAYLPIGQCGPSRAAIWTSRMPHANGVYTNRLRLPEDQLTISEILQANGYHTGIIGKCHLGKILDPEGYKRGFDERLIFYPDAGEFSDWFNYTLNRNGTKEHHTEYVTDLLTDEAIDFITASAGNQEPFFLWLAHVAPHKPNMPPEDKENTNVDIVWPPPNFNDDLSQKPPQQKLSRPHKLFEKRGETWVQEELQKAYLAMESLDSNIGRLLTKINELGIQDNTLIIYLSDNGVFYGEHQMARKGGPVLYDEIVKTPLIMSGPPSIVQNPGRSSQALVGSTDLTPTLLDILEIDVDESLSPFHGTSFLEVLQDKTPQHHRSFPLQFTQKNIGEFDTFPTRGLVFIDKDGTKYKWIHHGKAKYKDANKKKQKTDGLDFELYNITQDPYEMNNLMARQSSNDNPLLRLLEDPAHKQVMKKIIMEMARWQTQTHDPLRVVTTDKNGKEGRITTHLTSPTDLKLVWKTDQKTRAFIKVVPQNCPTCETLTKKQNSFKKKHKQKIKGLQPNTTYVIKIYNFTKRGETGFVRKRIQTN